jgi:Protein of unknown function (DUF742)
MIFPSEGVPDGETPTVRPYTVTGGRTRSGLHLLPIEALVRSASTGLRMSGEKRRILELTDQQYLSIAELSAHLQLPVGVVRVLVTDLSDERLATVHGHGSSGSELASSLPLSVLESVLNGISSL